MVHNLIRKMTIADVNEVHILDEITDKAPWSAKLVGDCITVGYDCWVMVENETIIGYGIMSYAANEAHLLKLAIHPDKQGMGFGQKLLQHLIHIAGVQNIAEMFLEVRVSNQRAINLYQKNKFAEIGMRKSYYPPNPLKGIPTEDALTMALTLW